MCVCMYIYIYNIHVYIYIYIYIYTCSTANLRTKILYFRGLDSSVILILKGGIFMSIGNSPERLSKQIYVGIVFVGRLGVSVDDLAMTVVG